MISNYSKIIDYIITYHELLVPPTPEALPKNYTNFLLVIGA